MSTYITVYSAAQRKLPPCPLCHMPHADDDHIEGCLVYPGVDKSSTWRLAYVWNGHVYIRSVYDSDIWRKAYLPALRLEGNYTLGRYMSTALVARNWDKITQHLTEGNYKTVARPHPDVKRREYGDLLLDVPDPVFHGGANPFREPVPGDINLVRYPTASVIRRRG